MSDDLIKRLTKAKQCPATRHPGPNERAAIFVTCKFAADALTAQAAEIERMKAALTRIATPSAFYVATADVNPEALARMVYAEKVRNGIRPVSYTHLRAHET